MGKEIGRSLASELLESSSEETFELTYGPRCMPPTFPALEEIPKPDWTQNEPFLVRKRRRTLEGKAGGGVGKQRSGRPIHKDKVGGREKLSPLAIREEAAYCD